MGACSAGIASAVVLLVGAAVFARPSAAVTVQHSADIHATHHVASSSECGRGVPCPGEPHQPQPHHQHSADARHAHYGGEHHHASLKVPHPPHHPAAAVTASAAAAAAAAEAAHHHIKGAGSMTGGSVTAGHHPHSIPQAMQKPAVQAAEAATGPDGKPVSCHSWGSELNVETEEDKLDRWGDEPECAGQSRLQLIASALKQASRQVALSGTSISTRAPVVLSIHSTAGPQSPIVAIVPMLGTSTAVLWHLQAVWH